MGRKKQEIPKSSTREYKTWSWMKARCLQKKSGNYKYYGGRGIKVCDRWMVFENFLEDMGKQPERSSLDRIDSNGDYTPENCKWSNKEEQMNNTRRNTQITYKSKTQTLAQWSRETGIPVGIILKRLKSGMDYADVFDASTVKKYMIDGEKINLTATVDRTEWLKLKTLGSIKGLSKHQITEEAIKFYNDAHIDLL